MRHFLWIDEKKQGPYDDEQIRAMLAKGAVAPITLALPEDGTDDWTETHLPSLIGPAKQDPPVVGPYYILQNDETKGPFTIGQLRGMWNSGTITVETLHCQEGFAEWLPLRTILHELEPPATPPPQSPPPPPTVVNAGGTSGCLSTLLKIVGGGWAKLLKTVGSAWGILGVLNLVGMFLKEPDGFTLMVGLLFSVLLFIIPGLILCGIGAVLSNRRAGR
jgi:hypothetical protein